MAKSKDTEVDAYIFIKEITLYCFSMQNFNRPKKEFDYLMGIFEKALDEASTDENIHKHKKKFSFITYIVG